MGVQFLAGVQLCRAALLDHDAARQHHHLIRTGYGAHPVGDDEDGFVFIAIFKNSANQNGIFAICSLRMLLVH